MVSVTGTGMGTVIFTIALVPGMPLTKTVARANPGGKLVIGAVVSEVGDQLVTDRNAVRPLSMLRSWTSG